MRLRRVFAAMMESFAGFLFASGRYGTNPASSYAGTEQALTSKYLSTRKRSCEKMNVSFAGLRTRYRSRLLSSIRLVHRSTPTKRRSTIRASLRKMWLLHTFANVSSTQTTWRDSGRSERLLSDAGFLLKLNNEPCGRTASIVGF